MTKRPLQVWPPPCSTSRNLPAMQSTVCLEGLFSCDSVAALCNITLLVFVVRSKQLL